MKLLTKALLFSLFLCFAAAVYLNAADKSFQSVQITIQTVAAGKQGDDFDARLAPLEKQLKALNYRSYRLLKKKHRRHAGKAMQTLKFQVAGYLPCVRRK